MIGDTYIPDKEVFIEPWIDPKGWDNVYILSLPTPCYVVSEAHLKRNLEILSRVQENTGCKILMALKGFSMYSTFPLIQKYLHGVAASSLDEARLGYEEFEGEVHIFSPAYPEYEMLELLEYVDHVVFNSFSQWQRFRKQVLKYPRKINCGIRVNPETSGAEVDIYNPCAPNSRLGVTRKEFKQRLLEGISGLHFHALCEQGADALEETLAAFERQFGQFLPAMQWVNFGGGHHITRADYNLELLESLLIGFKNQYPHLEVYLEPGEAVSLNAGVLVSTVQDIVRNGMSIAILDASASAHMPDVIEMPYRPTIIGGGLPGEYQYTYRLGGPTCLAGDVIGDYSFPRRLRVGDKIVLLNMAHYTMVKNTTFNGVRLPAIAVLKEIGIPVIVREFGYEDFKCRLS